MINNDYEFSCSLQKNALYLQRRAYAEKSCDMEKLCTCQIALITGGSRGIGFHVADYLLKAGAQVVFSVYYTDQLKFFR